MTKAVRKSIMTNDSFLMEENDNEDETKIVEEKEVTKEGAQTASENFNHRLFVTLHWFVLLFQLLGFVCFASIPSFLAGFNVLPESFSILLAFVVMIHAVKYNLSSKSTKGAKNGKIER